MQGEKVHERMLECGIPGGKDLVGEPKASVIIQTDERPSEDVDQPGVVAKARDFVHLQDVVMERFLFRSPNDIQKRGYQRHIGFLERVSNSRLKDAPGIRITRESNQCICAYSCHRRIRKFQKLLFELFITEVAENFESICYDAWIFVL